MGADFWDAFCGVSVAKKCTQVREVMRLASLFVYLKMSMLLITCGIHSLHSIAPCDHVGEWYHANVIGFDLYSYYSSLLFCRLCVCVRVCVGLFWISGFAVSIARVFYICV